jgi:hypothetical protein
MVGLREGSRAALRMRDAYLEPFADVADRSDLLEMFDASCRLARASRAIVWDGSAEEIELYLRDLDDGFGGM